MGNMKDFSMEVRIFLKAYRWRRVDPTPWVPLDRPLADCKLALVSSAALITPDADPFDFSRRGGDVTFRWVPSDCDPCILEDYHPSHHFDHAGLTEDRNMAFPIDRVNELAARGRIGAVNHRHLSFCGAITAPGRLIHETAPEAARALAADGVDVALLVPV